MRNLFNSFKLAFSFLTPVPFRAEFIKENYSKMLYFFPIAGLFSGSIIYFVHFLALRYIPEDLSFIIFFCVLIILILDHYTNNFLHIDGFCDCIDALYFMKKGKDKIKILKDPYLGMFATAWLSILLMLKLVVFFYIYHYSKLNFSFAKILFIYPVAGYLAVPFILFFMMPLFDSGLGHTFKEIISLRCLVVNFLISGILFYLIIGIKGCILLSIVIVINVILVSYFKKKFNGYNGDVLGFSIEIIRITALIYALVVEEIFKIS